MALVFGDGSLLPLTRKELGAGVDAETGLPVLQLDIDGMKSQRYHIEPETALGVACVLLVGAEPSLLPVVLSLLVREAGADALKAAQRGRFGDIGHVGAKLREAIDKLEEVARITAQATRGAEQVQPAASPDHECG